MPLIWDSLLVQALAGELRERLGHARLRGFRFEPLARRALLWFREGTLALDLHPERGTVVFGSPSPPAPGARPLPCRVERILAPPDDRVLLLELARVRGHRVPWLLVIELMTNQWNAILCEGETRTVRRLLSARGGRRPLAVGSPWRPPPPSRREGTDGSLPGERWRELLTGVEPGRRRETLLARVAWTSALNADAILGEAARDGGPAGAAALERGHALWTRLAGLAAGDVEETAPVLLERGPRGGDGLQPYPLPLPGLAATASDSLLAALARVASEGGDGAPTPALVPRAWRTAAEARVERARRRLGSLSRRSRSTPDPAALRGLGDLLLARYREVPSGASSVVLLGFAGEPVEVTLDPALAPHENADRYYERAGRAARARERLPALLAAAREELARAEALLSRLLAGEMEPDEVVAALPELGAPGDGGAPRTLPYHRYRSSGGLEIRVGKSAKANDVLTFRHASREDVWLHARHAAGAHVILRWSEEGNPPARDLAEAAVLAAFHSRARSSGSVPVDWTRRKYVRKPRKAAPGSVVPERVKTLFVEPDERVERRLRVEDEGEP